MTAGLTGGGGAVGGGEDFTVGGAPPTTASSPIRPPRFGGRVRTGWSSRAAQGPVLGAGSGGSPLRVVGPLYLYVSSDSK